MEVPIIDHIFFNAFSNRKKVNSDSVSLRYSKSTSNADSTKETTTVPISNSPRSTYTFPSYKNSGTEITELNVESLQGRNFLLVGNFKELGGFIGRLLGRSCISYKCGMWIGSNYRNYNSTLSIPDTLVHDILDEEVISRMIDVLTYAYSIEQKNSSIRTFCVIDDSVIDEKFLESSIIPSLMNRSKDINMDVYIMVSSSKCYSRDKMYFDNVFIGGTYDVTYDLWTTFASDIITDKYLSWLIYTAMVEGVVLSINGLKERVDVQNRIHWCDASSNKQKAILADTNCWNLDQALGIKPKNTIDDISRLDVRIKDKEEIEKRWVLDISKILNEIMQLKEATQKNENSSISDHNSEWRSTTISLVKAISRVLNE